MKFARLFGMVAVGILAFLLPACSNQGSGRIKVAFITNNPYDFWKIAQKGTEQGSKEADVDVEFRMPSVNNPAEEQRRIIEDLLSKGVKGIAISPTDAANQTEFFKEKVSPRVPLITQDSDLPDASARRCYIGTDNYTAGRAAGELVKKACPQGGEIMIFVGKLDVQNAIERRQGLLDELADKKKGEDNPPEKDRKFGKYTLIDTRTDDGDQQKCQSNVEDALVKYPNVACLIGLWEYNPPAIMGAVKQKGKLGKVAIVGFDENDQTLEGIKQGIVAGTVVQNPYEFGRLAVLILAGLARGDESVLKRKDIDGEHRIYVPHRIIDKSNVEEFHQKLRELKGK